MEVYSCSSEGVLCKIFTKISRELIFQNSLHASSCLFTDALFFIHQSVACYEIIAERPIISKTVIQRACSDSRLEVKTRVRMLALGCVAAFRRRQLVQVT